MPDANTPAADDGPIHEEPEQPSAARPRRLTFEEIAVKYNLPDDEIIRRRILAKMKKRVVSLAGKALDLRLEKLVFDELRGPVPGTLPRRLRSIRDHGMVGLSRDKHKLRVKARCAHIAYGFFKRRPYLAIENSCKVPPDWGRVKRMILDQDSAGEGVVLQQLAEWMSHVPASARRLRSQVH